MPLTKAILRPGAFAIAVREGFAKNEPIPHMVLRRFAKEHPEHFKTLAELVQKSYKDNDDLPLTATDFEWRFSRMKFESTSEIKKYEAALEALADFKPIASDFKAKPEKEKPVSNHLEYLIARDTFGTFKIMREKHPEEFERLNQLVADRQYHFGSPEWLPPTEDELKKNAMAEFKELVGGVVEKWNSERKRIYLTTGDEFDYDKFRQALQHIYANLDKLPAKAEVEKKLKIHAGTLVEKLKEAKDVFDAIEVFSRVHVGRLKH